MTEEFRNEPGGKTSDADRISPPHSEKEGSHE
jgi:hypothetical protein